MARQRLLSTLVAVLVFASVLSAAWAVGSASAQSGAPANNTTTSANYTLAELKPNGVHPSEAPDSLRQLGDPPRGGISLRYRSVGLFSGNRRFMPPGTTIQSDRIWLRPSVYYPPLTGKYTLRIVYWQEGTRTVQQNGTTTTETVATDVQVQTETFTIERGYSWIPIDLQAHYDDTWQVTAILMRDGEPVEGARWRFQHRSLQSAQPVPWINQLNDVIGWAILFVFLPGIGGVAVGIAGAWSTLRKTGTGPRLQRRKVVGGLAIGGLVLASTAYYQLTAVLANAPWLLGASMAVVAYVAGLRYRPDIENIAFDRMELSEAKPLRSYDPDKFATDAASNGDGGDEDGDRDRTPDEMRILESEYREESYKDLVIVPTVTVDGIRRVPKQGIKPFLARLFASAAELDLHQIRQRVPVRKGGISEVIYVDPEASTAFKHTPARLRRRIPVWHRVFEQVTECTACEQVVDDPDAEQCPYCEAEGAIVTERRERDLGLASKLVYAGLTGVVLLGIPLAGWVLAEQLINAPMVGFLLGTIPAIVDAHTAEDGELHFEPAPRHWQAVQATMTILRREYDDSKTLEEEREKRIREELRTEQEVLDAERQEDETLIKQGHERKVTPAVERRRNGGAEADADE